MGRKRLAVNVLRILWVLAVLWYELGIFDHSVSQCPWPDTGISSSVSKPAHVLIVADPQILDHRSYPGRPPFLTYLSRVFADLNLRKSWHAARKKEPDVVVFLGDMMDGGRFSMSDDEYETYYKRFASIFRVKAGTPVYFIPGNHDTGLGMSSAYGFSTQARDRYISHFGPLNTHVSIANHTVVLLDAPGLVEEDYQRHGRGHTYEQWRPVPGGPIQFADTFAQGKIREPVILMTHIPLSRPDSTNCGPLRESGTIRRGVGIGYQNTLGKDSSAFLLEKFRPSLIFSGDDHDYCEYAHTVETSVTPVREVTVKSLSMAMGIRRPGFQLLSLIPPEHSKPTFSDAPCLMPDQLGIYLSIYVPLILLSLIIVLLFNLNLTPGRRSGAPIPSPGGRAHNRTAPAQSRHGLRSRYDMETDSSYQTYEHPDPSGASDEVLYKLPSPATAQRSISHSKVGRSFVMGGRRRRFALGSTSISNFLKSFPWQTQTTGRHRQMGFVGRFLRDVRDVAVLPLGLFTLISWWTLTD